MQVERGDTVKVHYTGTLDDGSQFETTVDKTPLEFAVGWNEVIPGFDKAVIGMSPGDVKTVRIPVDEAYGPRDESQVGAVPLSDFPPDMDLKAGLILQVDHPDGYRSVVTVVDVSGDMATLDANHPLAGKDLNFEIELLEIL